MRLKHGKMLYQMTDKVAKQILSVNTMLEAVAKFNQLLDYASCVAQPIDAMVWPELVEACFVASRPKPLDIN